MGWEALADWGEDAELLEPLTGGAANQVRSVRVGGRPAVARLGTRSGADLAWETGLLVHLDRVLDSAGLALPVPVPTADGRLHSRGLVVMTRVDGEPPRAEADWRRVATAVRQVHAATRDWPQRPGWRSATDLLSAQRGTRIDLTAMPAEAVQRCRAAWARLAGRPACVVHGDLNPGNIRLTAGRVGLIDWDESRVDVPELDLALPHDAADLGPEALDVAAQASAAWEAAVCWDDDHSRRRLAEVRPVSEAVAAGAAVPATT